jgi:hypothetical protein
MEENYWGARYLRYIHGLMLQRSLTCRASGKVHV